MTTRSLSLEEFAEAMEELPDEVIEAVVRGLRSGARLLEGFVVQEITAAEPYPAVATGELAGSVVTTNFDDGAIVRVEAPHGPMMEEGTRPHFPPLRPIIDWVLVKRFATDEASARRVAYAVALGIAERGIAPRHFFRKAVGRAEPLIPREIVNELNRISG